MAETKRKGDLGEAMVIADLMKRGLKIAIPFGEDWRYDLIAAKPDGKFLRVQVKYLESDGSVIRVKCRSTNGYSTIRYTDEDIDLLAAYDLTTNKCYYIPSKMLGDGRSMISLRLKPTLNNQSSEVLWARDFSNLAS